MTHTFTVQAGGREREFTLRPNVPLAMNEWMDAARKSYEESEQFIPFEDAKEFIDQFYVPFLGHILTNRELCSWGLSVGYIGDHIGVDWYGDVDGEIVRAAVGALVTHFFVSRVQRMKSASTSSVPSPTSSTTEE